VPIRVFLDPPWLGYYTRVKCIHGLVKMFLREDLGSEVPRQVVVLGAGFDTLPMLLKVGVA
jgi:O-methyltransferase involved in polyketide biosynthesis